jgi:hypothetical protein
MPKKVDVTEDFFCACGGGLEVITPASSAAMVRLAPRGV